MNSPYDNPSDDIGAQQFDVQKLPEEGVAVKLSEWKLLSYLLARAEDGLIPTDAIRADLYRKPVTNPLESKIERKIAIHAETSLMLVALANIKTTLARLGLNAEELIQRKKISVIETQKERFQLSGDFVHVTIPHNNQIYEVKIRLSRKKQTEVYRRRINLIRLFRAMAEAEDTVSAATLAKKLRYSRLRLLKNLAIIRKLVMKEIKYLYEADEKTKEALRVKAESLFPVIVTTGLLVEPLGQALTLEPALDHAGAFMSHLDLPAVDQEDDGESKDRAKDKQSLTPMEYKLLRWTIEYMESEKINFIPMSFFHEVTGYDPKGSSTKKVINNVRKKCLELGLKATPDNYKRVEMFAVVHAFKLNFHDIDDLVVEEIGMNNEVPVLQVSRASKNLSPVTLTENTAAIFAKIMEMYKQGDRDPRRNFFTIDEVVEDEDPGREFTRRKLFPTYMKNIREALFQLHFNGNESFRDLGTGRVVDRETLKRFVFDPVQRGYAGILKLKPEPKKNT